MDIRVSETTPAQNVAAQTIKEKFDSGEFDFTLRRIASEGLADRLSGLISEITDWGKKIAEHPDIRDLKHYRGLVGEFINEVVTNSHEFSRENFLDRRGRHRVYGIVRLINHELDELAQELIKNEKNHIAILDKIDQIRGLLLDIVV
ncbi:MAG: YaaR family protein [Defluviitaleaceae bacterium]|nr:YaaR family protein [Defluviitaleaceae bacterium]